MNDRDRRYFHHLIDKKVKEEIRKLIDKHVRGGGWEEDEVSFAIESYFLNIKNLDGEGGFIDPPE